MSNVAFAVPPNFYYNHRTPADGVDDKELVRQFVSAVIERNKQRVEDWFTRVDSALAEIRAECSVDDWDGEGGESIDEATLALSREVARLLHTFAPAGTPPPDVIPESDGEVALSWTRTPDLVFSISIGAHGFLNYAGTVSDGVEAHDVARSGDEAAIATMAALLKQLYS